MDSILSPDDWAGWLESHAERFLLYARERTMCEADAEDVLQDALVEAWERTPTGRMPDGALVYATIRRRAIDQGRRREQAPAPGGTIGVRRRTHVVFD